MTDLFELIISRASHGVLLNPAPSAADLDKMIAAATSAPDHGRLKPWRFVVFEGAARERLGEMMAQSLRGRLKEADDAQAASEARKPMRAPMIVMVIAVAREAKKVPRIEQILSAGAAAENLILAAHALGFGSMWRTGEFVYDPQVKQALGLCEGEDIAGLIYVGSVAALPKSASPKAKSIDPSQALTRWPA